MTESSYIHCLDGEVPIVDFLNEDEESVLKDLRIGNERGNSVKGDSENEILLTMEPTSGVIEDGTEEIRAGVGEIVMGDLSFEGSDSVLVRPQMIRTENACGSCNSYGAGQEERYMVNTELSECLKKGEDEFEVLESTSAVENAKSDELEIPESGYNSESPSCSRVESGSERDDSARGEISSNSVKIAQIEPSKELGNLHSATTELCPLSAQGGAGEGSSPQPSSLKRKTSVSEEEQLENSSKRSKPSETENVEGKIPPPAPSARTYSETEVNSEDSDDEYEVEKVLHSGINEKGSVQYFVRWTGFDSDCLCTQLIEDYWRRYCDRVTGLNKPLDE